MNKIPQKIEKAKPFTEFIEALQLKFEEGLPNGHSTKAWPIALKIIGQIANTVNADICINETHQKVIEANILGYSQKLSGGNSPQESSEEKDSITLPEIVLHLTRTINEIRIHCGMCINRACRYIRDEDHSSNQFPTKIIPRKNQQPQDFVVAGFQSPETQTKLPIPRPPQTPSNNRPIGFRRNQES